MEVMPKKKHHIRLSGEERRQLETILRKGKANAHCQRHARILLLADTDGPEAGWSDSRIASAAHTSIPTVERVRRVCVEHGLTRALAGKDPEREYLRKLDGKAEAQLIALSCGAAPEGRGGGARDKRRQENGRAAPDGPCGSLRRGWLSWRSSIPSATRRCARR
jgi:hypothetical protein